jgi:DNA replication and repair protein RecF
MLESVTLRDFRCWRESTVLFDPGLTALVGRNGEGKTSILEAVCLLLRLASPRTSSRADLVRFGAPAGVVTGVLNGTEFRCAVSPRARRLAIDGAVCPRAGDYLALSGLVVWMDHADMGLLRGGSENRRRYLDFTCSQLFPDYLPALRAYERALRGRNYVLKRDASIAWPQAEAFAAVMSRHAEVLARRRAELCAALETPVAQAHRRMAREGEEAAVSCEPGWAGGDLAAELWERRGEESRLRVTAAGPHRDDLGLRLSGLDARRFASEGQQRTLALALKLAQARVLESFRGSAPVLLIDDVFGELDSARRAAFLEGLPEGTQKILTTTNLDWLAPEARPAAVWSVEGGSVLRLS